MKRTLVHTSDLTIDNAHYIRDLRRYIADTMRSINLIRKAKNPNMELYGQRKMELNCAIKERDKFCKEKLKEI
jgi:hypothetical protein